MRSSRWLFAAAVALLGCGHDWDRYDPRGAGPSPGGTGAGGAGGGGGTNPDCGPNGLLQLVDGFDDGVIDTVAWVPVEEESAGLSEQGGALVVSLPDPTDPIAFAGVFSRSTYDLTGCGIMVRVLEVPDPATHGYAQISANADGIGYVEILQEGGKLYAKKVINDVHTFFGEVIHDPVAHAFWRIRESGGLVLWETSSNGQAWAILAIEPAPMPVTAIQVGISAGTYKAEPVPAGVYRVDAVNVPP